VRSAETTFGTVTNSIVTIAALASVVAVYLFMRMNADPANMGTETSALPDNSRTLQSDTKARAPRRAEALVVGKFFQT
jgi:hypothetical protein